MTDWRVENMVTLAITGATMIGLYAVGAGAYSFWPLVFLFNLNSPRAPKSDGDETE